VRYLRVQAARLGIDPGRLAAGGGSAGGHVAAATGMIDGLEEPAEATAVSSKPNALALFNPVYNNGPEDGWGHDRVIDYWQEISPAHNITGDDPPAIVFLGTEDNLIPVAVAEKFDADMKAAGLKSELHLYQGQGHGFFNESKGGSDNFLDTLRKLDKFFAALGYLEGEPTEAQLKAVSKTEDATKGKAK
jgi:acetyl esterase/lipase